MRKWLLISAVAALCSATIACRGSTARTASKPARTAVVAPAIGLKPGEPLKIGVSVALTGDQGKLGQDIADAAELAVVDRGGTLKGHPIQIVRVDDGCADAEKAASAARSLIDSAVAGVIGPMCTTGAQAADALYEAAHIVHIAPAATRVDLSTQGERFFFRTSWRDDAQGATQAAYARDTLGAGNALLVDDGDPYGRGLADAFSAAFEAKGGNIVARQRLGADTTDVTGFAAQVKGMGADIVVFEGLNPEAPLILRSLRFAQYGGPFLGPDGILSSRDFIVGAGPAAEGAFVTGGALPDATFIARFQDRFKREPATPFVLQTHDAVSLLLAAIEGSATDDGKGVLSLGREELGQSVRARQYPGLTGPIQFDDQGDRLGDSASSLGLAIYRVSNGRFELVR